MSEKSHKIISLVSYLLAAPFLPLQIRDQTHLNAVRAYIDRVSPSLKLKEGAKNFHAPSPIFPVANGSIHRPPGISVTWYKICPRVGGFDRSLVINSSVCYLELSYSKPNASSSRRVRLSDQKYNNTVTNRENRVISQPQSCGVQGND